MKLAEVFASRDDIGRALASYGDFAKKRDTRKPSITSGRKSRQGEWSIPHKFGLYRHAARAWDRTLDDAAREGEFTKVLQALRGWRIARNGTLLLSDTEIFSRLDSLTPIRAIKRASDDLQAAIRPVEALRNVKSASGSWRSPMALSKILHFFTPRIYPVYDNEIIEGIVLRQFREEWTGFEQEIRVSISWPHTGTIYYLKYMLWCEQMLTVGGNLVRDEFARWIERQNIPYATAALAHGLDATAFEMIAIGAAHLQADATRGSSPP